MSLSKQIWFVFICIIDDVFCFVYFQFEANWYYEGEGSQENFILFRRLHCDTDFPLATS